MLSIHNSQPYIYHVCMVYKMHRRNKRKKIQHVYVSKNTLTCTYYNNGNDMISCFLRMLIKERINDGVKNENKK